MWGVYSLLWDTVDIKIFSYPNKPIVTVRCVGRGRTMKTNKFTHTLIIPRQVISRQAGTHTTVMGEQDVRRLDPFARLLFRDVVIQQARFRQWQTGTTQARQRVILGQAWVFDRRQSPESLTKGVIRKHNNSPDRGKQSPNGKKIGQSENTQARIFTQENRQGKTRLS